MRFLLATALLLALSSCSFVNRKWVQVTAKESVSVYENEFVVWADGWWCEFSADRPLIEVNDYGVTFVSGGGMCGDVPAHPPGIYLVDFWGKVVDSLEPASVSTYDDSPKGQTRGCEWFSSQGIACAPNFQIEMETNDPLFGQLWGLSERGLGIERLWAGGGSSPDVRVAVIDTGVMCGHEEFISCSGEFDAIQGAIGQEDENGHGSHCAGTIGARGGNGRGISGVTKETSLFAAKFMDANGSGSLYAAAKSIQWAIEQDVHIISASWGGIYGNAVLKKAIQKADEAGILFVVAAGNDASNIDEEPQYPASYDFENVITVGSHTKDGEMSYFSNYGKETVEVFAPGSDILSTWNDGGYKAISGTSMATPHVAGLAALLWQRELGNGTKREQMLRVRDAIFEMGTGELTDASRHGVIRVEGVKAPSECNARKCKKCVRQCKESLQCKCKRLRNCKGKCFNKTNCTRKCK